MTAAGAQGRHPHAYPKADNAPSHAGCRKAGRTLLGEPASTRCNDWRVELSGTVGGSEGE